MPPEKHALLSASSAARWLKCTAAPRFEETLPESTSPYAEEGRLAHELAELKTLKKFTTMAKSTYTKKLKPLKENPLYTAEMDRCTDEYVQRLTEAAMSYALTPSVAAEVRVDFSAYVPEGFGTCDNTMIGEDTLSITDFKYGQGVAVSAENNAQMRLYALGALERYSAVYGDAIKKIRMSIDQPRLNAYTTEEITAEELKAWGESIKPIAEEAYSGNGNFVPGEHCRFCRGRAVCRARAKENTALEEFKDVSERLSEGELGGLLTKAKELVKWAKDLEEYVQTRLLEGKAVPGWKLVEGRSDRAFTDQDKALEAVLAAGYDEALIFDRKPKTLAGLEKLMGKAEFTRILGEYVYKPPGKPTLAPESDKRPAFNSAASDFADIVNQ